MTELENPTGSSIGTRGQAAEGQNRLWTGKVDAFDAEVESGPDKNGPVTLVIFNTDGAVQVRIPVHRPEPNDQTLVTVLSWKRRGIQALDDELSRSIGSRV